MDYKLEPGPATATLRFESFAHHQIMGLMPVGSDLAAGNTKDGRIKVLGFGVSGDAWSNRQSAPLGWSGWSDFGYANGASLCLSATHSPQP